MGTYAYDIPGSMKAGDLRHRIQLEGDRLTEVNGAEVRMPEIYATRWAEVVSLAGVEALKSETVASLSKFQVTMRYAPDVLPQHRVIFQGLRLDIVSISSDEARHSKTIVQCQTYAS